MALREEYWRRAAAGRVIDGDTLVMTLDCGLYLYSVQRIRLLDVNCPETRGTSGEELTRALAAKAYTEAWVDERALENPAHADYPLWLRTVKADSFGRWLGRVESADGRCLNTDLMLDGHAAPAKSARGTW